MGARKREKKAERRARKARRAKGAVGRSRISFGDDIINCMTASNHGDTVFWPFLYPAFPDLGQLTGGLSWYPLRLPGLSHPTTHSALNLSRLRNCLRTNAGQEV